MGYAGIDLLRILEGCRKAEKLRELMEQHETEAYMKQAVKHGLLAFRSIVDSMLELLEEEESPPKARKINIAEK